MFTNSPGRVIPKTQKWYLMPPCLALFLLILLSSHFKNGPEYLTTERAQIFIPLMKFLKCSLVSSIFLVLLRYSLFIFSFISACVMVSASDIPKYLKISISPSVLILSRLVSSIPFVQCRFSVLAWYIFLWQIPSRYLNCISTLPVLGFPILSHFWQTVWCCQSSLGSWFFFL